MTAADLSRIAAIVPVRSLTGAKSRLGEPLDPEERAELVLALLRKTVAAATGASRLRRVAVVSRDAELLDVARDLGAAPVLQRGEGLNEGLEEAAVAPEMGEVTALLVLPADLPNVDAGAIDRFVDEAEEAARAAPERSLVALVPDRRESGTNALLLSPPDVIEFHFGEGSRVAHREAAGRAGAIYFEGTGPLAFDLDTPEDLLEADLGGLSHEGGR
jgi:2-phospho-L-lactate guanylyltransferase